MQPPDKPEPPKARTGPGFAARRGRRPLKLLKTLRGDGVLMADGADLPVSYQLDLYSDGDRTLGSGSLDGDFTGRADSLEGAQARLTLEDGAPMDVTLEQVEDDGAEFEAGAAPSGDTGA